MTERKPGKGPHRAKVAVLGVEPGSICMQR
jgi:hypothetical protein